MQFGQVTEGEYRVITHPRPETAGRPAVMPATDLGIQKGVQIIYALPALPKPDGVLAATQHLSPYRSVAAWYLWRAVDD